MIRPLYAAGTLYPPLRHEAFVRAPLPNKYGGPIVGPFPSHAAAVIWMTGEGLTLSDGYSVTTTPHEEEVRAARAP